MGCEWLMAVGVGVALFGFFGGLACLVLALAKADSMRGR